MKGSGYRYITLILVFMLASLYLTVCFTEETYTQWTMWKIFIPLAHHTAVMHIVTLGKEGVTVLYTVLFLCNEQKL